ncbi:MAG: hypothetical protein NZ703_09490, partial [Gemmataceae bacterium]|nr:hypothetical protein [Gemmataceae bacterium]
VIDVTGRLSELAKAYYSGHDPSPTLDELVTYIIRWEPLAVASDPSGQASRMDRSSTRAPGETIAIHDCSGIAAARCLQAPVPGAPLRTSASENAGAPAGQLHQALQEADALLLLVAATASEGELRRAFQQMFDFLQAIQAQRSQQRRVGGFPVFVVLTQCDRLARPGDSHCTWEARIRLRCEYAYVILQNFLRCAGEGPVGSSVAETTVGCTKRSDITTEGSVGGEIEAEAEADAAAQAYLPFGRVDLQVYAVAVRQPPLIDLSARTDEPYRVAELFRDVVRAALGHHHRQIQADHRLRWLVRGTLALFLAGATLLITLVLAPPRLQEPSLLELVSGYQEHEPPPAERLAPSRIHHHRQTLERFRDHPDFEHLPPALQGFVFHRLREIEDYLTLYRRLRATPGPAACRTRIELDQLARTLQEGALAIPHRSGYDWSGTEVGRWHDKWLADIAVIRQAEQQLVELYRDRVRRVQQLLNNDNFAGNWREDATGVLQLPEPPYTLDEPLPGATTVADLPNAVGQAVSWFVPYHFEQVVQWRGEWLRWHQRLHSLRDLMDACGLTTGSDLPPAPLALPQGSPAGPASDNPLDRWQQLQQHYAVYLNQPALWEWHRFPEPARAVLREHSQRFLQRTGRWLRAQLQDKLGEPPGATDTLPAWRRLADALQQPTPTMIAWNRLLHLLLRQNDPHAKDPLQELLSFLQQAHFVLELRGVDVVLPPDLALEPARPSGPFLLTIKTAQGELRQQFVQVGPPLRDGSDRVYIFQAEKVEALQFHPGDSLQLQL